MSNFPAISVIIPLYNAENFIGECLESLLAQTFQNFEVIVVDDCSTDNSVAVVENYAKKFGRRLKLSRTPKNFGSGARPRNKGLKLSRGEFVFNMDNDDLLVPTALEELMTLAENFSADVVYCEKYYRARADLSEVRICSEQTGNLIEEPTLETDDPALRVQAILDGRFWVAPWSKLVRRDLLLEHEIFFPPCKISDDDIWTCELIFCAGKILRVPNTVYVNRITDDSLSRIDRTPAHEIIFWLDPLVSGLKSFDDFMGEINFFRQNPQYRLAILDHLINGRTFAQINRYCEKISPVEIYETIRRNFAKDFGQHDVLFAYLCTLVHEQRKNLRLCDEQLRQ